jgi:hypothetical protein
MASTQRPFGLWTSPGRHRDQRQLYQRLHLCLRQRLSGTFYEEREGSCAQLLPRLHHRNGNSNIDGSASGNDDDSGNGNGNIGTHTQPVR